MVFVASTARGGACHQCGANCSIEMISNVSNTFRYSKRKRERKGENSRIPWRTWIKNDQTLITFHPTISVSYPLFSIVSYVESLRLRQWTAKDQAASQRAPWRWRSSRSLVASSLVDAPREVGITAPGVSRARHTDGGGCWPRRWRILNPNWVKFQMIIKLALWQVVLNADVLLYGLLW